TCDEGDALAWRLTSFCSCIRGVAVRHLIIAFATATAFAPIAASAADYPIQQPRQYTGRSYAPRPAVRYREVALPMIAPPKPLYYVPSPVYYVQHLDEPGCGCGAPAPGHWHRHSAWPF